MLKHKTILILWLNSFILTCFFAFMWSNVKKGKEVIAFEIDGSNNEFFIITGELLDDESA